MNNKLTPQGESSHKLKTVMEEIKILLDWYDLAAVVILHTPGHSEFLQKINPSYSCAFFVNGGIQFNTKTLNVSNEEKMKLILNTANMFKLLAGASGRIAMTMVGASEFIDQKVGAEHGSGKVTEHKPKSK